MRGAILLLLMVVASCSRAEEDAPSNRTGEIRRPERLLSIEELSASPITKEWLVGYWAYEGNCDQEETSLWPDGTYTMGDGNGRWSLTGSTLIVEPVKLPSTSYMQVRLGDGGPAQLRKLGPNAMQVDWGGGMVAGGAGGRFLRCD